MIRRGRVVGVDLGSQRIGVAVTDSDQTIATGVATVPRAGDRPGSRRRLAAIVADYDAVGVVVGVPVSMSGRMGPAARAALEEVEAIRAELADRGVEVETVDERLTTVAAAGALRAGGRPARAQRAVIDQTAAAVILQGWIDRRSRDRSAGD